FARTLTLSIRQRWPFRGAASHGSMVMWRASRYGMNTRIDQHLNLVTTIFARPEMTDFVLAHVLRPLPRNHQLITFTSRHSVGRAINDPSSRHGHLPYGSFLYGVGH